jgi:hypothetical protein
MTPQIMLICNLTLFHSRNSFLAAFILFSLAHAPGALAQIPAQASVPKLETYVPLFVIEHSSNSNAVHYEAKLKDGKLDPQQPVVAYWVMATENGKRQELNLLERLKAYGFDIKPDRDPEAYRLTIVSDKKKEIHVFRMGSTVRAAAKIGGCDAYLDKIFIASKKSWLVSLPDYAEMFGTDMSTGAPCHERVTPADR